MDILINFYFITFLMFELQDFQVLIMEYDYHEEIRDANFIDCLDFKWIDVTIISFTVKFQFFKDLDYVIHVN